MEYVLYEEQRDIGILTLSRQEALNALNSRILEELDKTLDRIDTEYIRCLILTGQGKKAFAAGADIGEMYRLSPQEAEDFGRKGNAVFRKIENYPIPVVAAVNGFALGGGCELAMCCDIRICSENAVFGQPEVGLGIIPGFGGTQRLPRLVGLSAAKQMLYTAQTIDAAEALRIGLVSMVCPVDLLMERAIGLAEKICKNAPIAVRNCKKAVDQGIEQRIEDGIAVESRLFGSCFASQDQKEGMTAFLEKRKIKEFRNM